MTPRDSESRRVELEVDGSEGPTSLRYFEAGDGEDDPLLLLHGVGLDAAAVSWKHAIPALADEYRILAPDFPGHGGSDKPRIRYTTEYFLDVLRAFVERLDLTDPSLAGISMGGGVALGYALEHGVDRLALVDSYGLGRDAYWRPPAAAALRTPGLDRVLWRSMGLNSRTVRGALGGYVTSAAPSFVEEIRELLQDPATGRALRSWQRSEFRPCGFRTCYLEQLGNLGVPTLLVHGEDDTLLPVSWSRRADERLPDSELRVFGDCGHWPPRERPAAFNRLLSSFLPAG